MSKVSINLLPPELEKVKKARVNKSIISTVSVGFLVVCIILALGVLLFRLAQNQDFQKWTKEVSSQKDIIKSTTNIQKSDLSTAAKARVDSITKVTKTDLPAAYAYTLILKLIPEQMFLNTMTVDKKGKLVLDIETTNLSTLDQFLNNLNDPVVNNNKISNVTVESLSRGKTDEMRLQISTVLPESAVTQ
jgi:hypothetical protein